MNSFERITAAVLFEQPDRVPVSAQVLGHAATSAGVALDEYIQDGALLARCQLGAVAAYDYDAVFGPMDVNVEAEPLAIPDPATAVRMPELLKAPGILCRAFLDDVVDGGGFVLSLGCEMPVEARQANVAALVQAARKTG